MNDKRHANRLGGATGSRLEKRHSLRRRLGGRDEGNAGGRRVGRKVILVGLTTLEFEFQSDVAVERFFRRPCDDERVGVERATQTIAFLELGVDFNVGKSK